MTRRSAPQGAPAVARQSDQAQPTASIMDDLSKHRVEYRLAGAVFRDTVERAARCHLGSRDRAVLDAVFAVTVSFSKLHDSTTTRQLTQIAYGTDEVDGRDRERIAESLNKLAMLGLIDLTRTGKGRGARLVVSVGLERTPLALVGDSREETPPAVMGVDGETPPAAGRNTPRGATETPPASAAHLEGTEKDLGKPFGSKWTPSEKNYVPPAPSFHPTCPTCDLSTLACRCAARQRAAEAIA